MKEYEKIRAARKLREITSRLYTIQYLAGLPEDWVMEQTKQIAADFQNKTGLS